MLPDRAFGQCDESTMMDLYLPNSRPLGEAFSGGTEALGFGGGLSTAETPAAGRRQPFIAREAVP